MGPNQARGQVQLEEEKVAAQKGRKAETTEEKKRRNGGNFLKQKNFSFFSSLFCHQA
jgi:hypothetical protein